MILAQSNLWSDIQNLLYRVMPMRYWYIFVTAMAVIAVAVGIWRALRKKQGG